MNFVMTFGLKMLVIILSLGNVFSAPIKQEKIIDPFIALLPERPSYQLDNNVYLISPPPPPEPHGLLYLPKTSEIIIDHPNETNSPFDMIITGQI
jgi:hypothetical protein